MYSSRIEPPHCSAKQERSNLNSIKILRWFSVFYSIYYKNCLIVSSEAKNKTNGKSALSDRCGSVVLELKRGEGTTWFKEENK
jgi:hypothetical protein